MTDYNKIVTTVNSITPDYQFIPDLNNTIVIDTSENRIGINTITPDESIHVSGGTIKTKDSIVLGDLSVNIFR
jgi:ethanolamine utilization microcompartment shell protein EutS